MNVCQIGIAEEVRIGDWQERNYNTRLSSNRFYFCNWQQQNNDKGRFDRDEKVRSNDAIALKEV